jgi:hypothetical protein
VALPLSPLGGLGAVAVFLRIRGDLPQQRDDAVRSASIPLHLGP